MQYIRAVNQGGWLARLGGEGGGIGELGESRRGGGIFKLGCGNSKEQQVDV